jgi:hypothetical protein
MRGTLGTGALRVFLLALVSSAWGCGSEGPAVQGAAAADPKAPEVEPGEPTILRRPFTAEQIRDEWIEGLTLVLERTTAEGPSRQRWTVVRADADGAEIEYAILDAAGNPTGEKKVERSAWVELRDHASFPVGHSRREPATRETPLGTLDGWVYTVEDPQDGTLNELFFATSLPGAPVLMSMSRNGEVLARMAMVERLRPQ